MAAVETTLRERVLRAQLMQAARQQLERSRRENPLRWALPPGYQSPDLFRWMPRQIEAFERWAPGLLDQPAGYDAIQAGIASPVSLIKIFGFLAGNRAGKSEWAKRAIIGCALGLNPARLHELPQDPRSWALGPPRLIWCVTLTWEKSRQTQQRHIAEGIPPALLAKGVRYDERAGFYLSTCVLRNGTRIVFKTAEQGLLTFEGDPVHAVWVDEAVPLPYIQASLVRTTDTRGPVLVTAWPSDPDYHDLFVDRSIAPDKPRLSEREVGYVTAGMADNVYLSRQEVELQERLIDPAEAEGRIHGRFAARGGLIYPQFDARIHTRSVPLPLPTDWTRYEIIDPGWAVPCAVVFGAMLPDHTALVYDEIYVRQHTVGQIAALILGRRWKWSGALTPAELEQYEALVRAAGSGSTPAELARIRGVMEQYRRRCGPCEPARILIDPAAGQRDQGKPVSTLDQFREAGIVAAPSSNAHKDDQQARVRDWLRPIDGKVRLRIGHDCTWTQYEFRHYREKPAPAGQREHAGDAIRVDDRHNHTLSCIEYWLADNPSWQPGRGDAPAGWFDAGQPQRDSGGGAAWRRRG